MSSPSRITQICVTCCFLGIAISPGNAYAQRQRQLTDQDILNPSRLVFDRVVTFADSFDNTPKGTIFVSKRSILGHPQRGVLGEAGSPNHRAACLFFCPMGTGDIDATYVYIIQQKGECTIGVRAIGWTQILEEFQGSVLTGRTVEIGRVSHTGKAINIGSILINNRATGAPINAGDIAGPHGTNYRYFPRQKNFLGEQTTAKEGFITDIHFFEAGNIREQVGKGDSFSISMPGWQPEIHTISGPQLAELRKLTNECDSD